MTIASQHWWVAVSRGTPSTDQTLVCLIAEPYRDLSILLSIWLTLGTFQSEFTSHPIILPPAVFQGLGSAPGRLGPHSDFPEVFTQSTGEGQVSYYYIAENPSVDWGIPYAFITLFSLDHCHIPVICILRSGGVVTDFSSTSVSCLPSLPWLLQVALT